MLTSTSLKHPTVQRKIKEATTKAIRWAKGTSDTYNSVSMFTIGTTSVFIRANNKGKVVSAIAYNDRTGERIGDIKQTIADSL